MRGKLILSSISSPKEGMQVVFNFSLWWKIGTLDKKKGGLWQIWVKPKDSVDFTCDVKLSELKQIIIEYRLPHDPRLNREESKKRDKGEYETLPLHPSDWEYGLGHIGEEVEFKEESIYIDGIYVAGDTFNLKNIYTFAKLILPSKEIVYSEEEVKKKLRAYHDYFMDCVQTVDFHPDPDGPEEWFEQNKKK